MGDKLLIVILVLALLAGPVLSVVALVSVFSLKRRLQAVEIAFARWRDAKLSQPAAEAGARAQQAPAQTPAPEPEPQARSAAPPPVAPSPGTALPPPLPEPTMPAPTRAAPAPMPELWRMPPEPLAQEEEPAESPSSPWMPEPSEPNFIERGIEHVKRWFTNGNVPIKVGMLVMLAGVAALLKYASDQGWLTLPIELRLAGISAAALAALAFAWRKRESHRAFALALQGGAIGVLLLTVFAAFKNYGLIQAMPAFAISVVLIFGLAVMAVLQESRTLAILGVLAGFMAPIWLATGSGNHVGLFSYYALLNAGIFAIAWVRPWRILNLLGFVFTWGIGTAWGVLQYSPDKFASTEPFLALFFVFYLLLPLLYARKAPTPGNARIDGCLLFGTPLVAFSLQAGLLHGDRMMLAMCALGVAVAYALLAWLLRGRERLRHLMQGYAILAVGFATLAVPLALSARATASIFALEGAGLVWLGLAQERRLSRWAGIGLQLAAAFALLLSLADLGHGHPGEIIFANARFMGALLIALAGFATAGLYRNAGKTALATLAYLWGLFWWTSNLFLEIARFIEQDNFWHAVLLMLGATGWLAAEVHRRKPWQALSLTMLGGFALAFVVAIMQMVAYGQPFAGYGGAAWAVFALLGLRSLLCLRATGDAIAGLAQLAWWWLWPTVLSLLAWYVGDKFKLQEGWVAMLLALPWLLLLAVSMRRWPWLRHPLGEAFDGYRNALQVMAFALLGLWWLASLFNSGDAAPLPWVALFNPLDLAQLAVLALLAMRLAESDMRSAQPSMLALAGVLLISVITLRAVHHWDGEYWDVSLIGTQLAQTSLTVVWSLLGVVGWVSGSRRGQWSLWLGGAVLMGVVLLKLLLIDRNNLGDLLGIGAFIAYGLLCTLVGWLAPAPPRKKQPEEVSP